MIEAARYYFRSIAIYLVWLQSGKKSMLGGGLPVEV